MIRNEMTRGNNWPMKFRPFQRCWLAKEGQRVLVEIEGVRIHNGLDEAVYDVREFDSGIGYPALESKLKPFIMPR